MAIAMVVPFNFNFSALKRGVREVLILVWLITQSARRMLSEMRKVSFCFSVFTHAERDAKRYKIGTIALRFLRSLRD
ncbi:MAG: hypothetical protein ACI9XB_003299 [Gammaproteobacteria bacterium]